MIDNIADYGKLATDKYKNYKNNATLAVRDILTVASNYGLEYKKGKAKV